MTTTISLVTTHHLTELHIFFLVLGTFRIYSLGNFQIYITVLLTIVPILYMTSLGLI